MYILFFYDEQSITGMQMSGTVRHNVFAAAAYHHHQRSGRQIHVTQSIAGLKMTLGQRYGVGSGTDEMFFSADDIDARSRGPLQSAPLNIVYGGVQLTDAHYCIRAVGRMEARHHRLRQSVCDLQRIVVTASVM